MQEGLSAGPAKLVYKKISPLAQQAMKSFPLMLSQQ
jgi:hypothetical protein